MHATKDPLPNGLILLSHPEQLRITPKEMADALPEEQKVLPRLSIELDMGDIAQQAIRARDWSAAQRVLEERFREQVSPVLKQHPDYRIVYFGSSPVPLTILLGFLLETWQQVDVVPHHHMQRTWGWLSEPEQPPARLALLNLPNYQDRTQGEAIIRVSTSHPVDPQMTLRVVPAPLLQFDIALERPSEDAFTRPGEMQEVARAFREALDVIGDRFPGIQRVHLFAAVQPGMALLLGAQISKTMHPAVLTYQYARNTENEAYHVPAVLVNGPSQPEPLPLTAEEEARATGDREQLGRDVERMKGLTSQLSSSSARSWFAALLCKPKGHPDFSTHWLHLPALHETPLRRTSVDLETRTVEDSFRLEQTRLAWQLDDHWLARLARRLPEQEKRQRALRMLVLHELAHRGRQSLTSRSSRQIGRFPKVLEEMDYHADVWAMLHEYVLTKLQSPQEVSDPRTFFMNLVLTATQTMWVFDDAGHPMREFQIRRLNRYLIWYWQYLLLERGAGQGQETTLDTVLSILAQRPVIELAGPGVFSRNERVFFALDAARVNAPELAIYHEGHLFRDGPRPDFQLDQLLAGARECNGEKILDVLRSAFEQTVR